MVARNKNKNSFPEKIVFPEEIIREYQENKLKKQKTKRNTIVLCSVLAVFLVVFLSISSAVLFPNIPVIKVANGTIIKQEQIVAGQPTKWVILIPKDQIKVGKYLAQLPKNASNISLATISSEQAKNISTEKLTSRFSLDQRQQLAVAPLKSSKNAFGIINNSALASLGDAFKYMFADLGDAAEAVLPIDNVIQTVVDGSAGQGVVSTLDATYVNITSDTPAPVPSPEISPTTDTPIVAAPEATPTTETSVVPVVPVVPETPASPSVDTTKDYVAVTYETPAPQITAEVTDSGQQVTVSAPTETSQAPLTDVLASSKIPKLFKVGQEDKIQIKWQNNGNQNVAFNAYDTNNDGYLDYVEWTVPHLSTQVFNIIFISKAFQLDTDQSILADIYDQVKTQDNNYATINNGQYVRFTFEKQLTNQNDNTIYARPTTQGQPGTIEVYPIYTDADGNVTEGPLLATFPSIDHEGKYQVLLKNLQTPTDTFQFKVSGSVDFDYIVDPLFHWVGGDSNFPYRFGVSDNWQELAVPDYGDDVDIPSGPAGNVFLNMAYTNDGNGGVVLGNVTIESGASLTNFSTIKGGTYSGAIENDVTISGGTFTGTVTNASGATIDYTTGTTPDLTGATVINNGTIICPANLTWDPATKQCPPLVVLSCPSGQTWNGTQCAVPIWHWVGGDPTHENMWGTPANWQEGTVPPADANIEIGSGATYCPVIASGDSNDNYGGVTLGNVTMDNQNCFIENNGTITDITGALVNNGNGTAVVNYGTINNISGSITNAGPGYVISNSIGGIITINSNLSLDSGGGYGFENIVGIITINGTVTNTNGMGIYNMDGTTTINGTFNNNSSAPGISISRGTVNGSGLIVSGGWTNRDVYMDGQATLDLSSGLTVSASLENDFWDYGTVISADGFDCSSIGKEVGSITDSQNTYSMCVAPSGPPPVNTNTWAGGGDGSSWNDASNWNGGVPTNGSTVDIGSATVTVPFGYDLASNFGAGTVNGSAGTIILQGIFVDNNPTFNVAVTLDSGTINTGTFTNYVEVMSGQIDGGWFDGVVTNDVIGTINAGFFSYQVNNYGTIDMTGTTYGPPLLAGGVVDYGGTVTCPSGNHWSVNQCVVDLVSNPLIGNGLSGCTNGTQCLSGFCTSDGYCTNQSNGSHCAIDDDCNLDSMCDNNTCSAIFAGSILVSNIYVTGNDSATTVVNGQTLQMSAAVLPDNAENKTVTWSVINGTGTATINSSGLLTATGLGVVTVKSTANDNSGTFGTAEITITTANIPVNPVSTGGGSMPATATNPAQALSQPIIISIKQALNQIEQSISKLFILSNTSSRITSTGSQTAKSTPTKTSAQSVKTNNQSATVEIYQKILKTLTSLINLLINKQPH